MTNYYIVINSERKGPMSFDQLVGMTPHANDLVWHEGMDDWQEAKTLPELQGYFGEDVIMPPPIPSTPPPHQRAQETQPTTLQKEPAAEDAPKGNKGRAWLIVLVCVVGLTAIVYFGSMHQDKVTYQRNAEAIERNAEAERQAAAERQRKEQRINELKAELYMLDGLANECQDRLEEAEKPKLFRLRSEKERELKAIREERNGYAERMTAIMGELQSLGVDMDLD